MRRILIAIFILGFIRCTTDDPVEPPSGDSQPGDPNATGDAGDADPVVEPHLTLVNPRRGRITGGTEILLLGTGFTADTEIVLGGAQCDNTNVIDETAMVCHTPPNPAGVYDLMATNGVASNSLPAAFTYFQLDLTSIEPNRGSTYGGMPTEIRGGGFTAATQVVIDGHVALSTEVISPTVIRFLTPPSPPGNARVQVSNAHGLASIDDGFTYYAPLRIDRVLSGAGLSSGGESVLLEGEGFTGSLEVHFGLVPASIVWDTDVELYVVTPPGSPDSYVDLSVSSDLTGAFTQPDGYYYYGSTPGLALFKVAPRRGSVRGGDEVALSGGTALDTVTQVTFGSNTAAIVEQTDRYLLVTTPASVSSGPVDVNVTDGSQATSLMDGYTYVGAFTVDAINPAQGDAAGGTPVTITGSGFPVGTEVRIGISATVSAVDPTTLQVVTPPGAVGLADVVVEGPNGLQEILADGFTFTTPLSVLGMSPNRGTLAGGTTVLIRGTGFVPPLSVTFDGLPATELEIFDAVTMAVRTPAHAAESVDVAVQVGSGSPVTASEEFLYYDP